MPGGHQQNGRIAKRQGRVHNPLLQHTIVGHPNVVSHQAANSRVGENTLIQQGVQRDEEGMFPDPGSGVDEALNRVNTRVGSGGLTMGGPSTFASPGYRSSMGNSSSMTPNYHQPMSGPSSSDRRFSSGPSSMVPNNQRFMNSPNEYSPPPPGSGQLHTVHVDRIFDTAENMLGGEGPLMLTRKHGKTVPFNMSLST